MPNKVNATSEAENTAFNHDAVKKSAQSTKISGKMCTDYSIKGKERGTYKQDAD